MIRSLTGMSLHRTLIPALGLEAAANLGLSIVLVQTLGIVGVALGALIPSVLVNLAFIPRSLYRKPPEFLSDFSTAALYCCRRLHVYPSR